MCSLRRVSILINRDSTHSFLINFSKVTMQYHNIHKLFRVSFVCVFRNNLAGTGDFIKSST